VNGTEDSLQETRTYTPTAINRDIPIFQPFRMHCNHHICGNWLEAPP